MNDHSVANEGGTPRYKKILEGKKGIIFGALDEKSIAWKTALQCVHEGAEIVLTNAPIAERMGKIKELAEACEAISKKKTPVRFADVTYSAGLNNLFNFTKVHFGGGVDFILHSVGMSPNVRKKNPYTNLNYDFMQKTLDVSAMSLHRVLQIAMEQDMINEWGSVIALTYVAAQRVFPDYSDMADAKALLESIARSFGYHYGVKKKVRINTVSQSPTRTTAGSGVKGFDGFMNYAEKMSPLGNADAQQCAEYCVTLFSDYTKMVTMQNLFHDGGFSSSGVTAAIIDQMEK